MSRHCSNVATNVLADVMVDVVPTDVATLPFDVTTLVSRCQDIDFLCFALLNRCHDFAFSMSLHCFSILSPDVDVVTLFNRCHDIEADVAKLVTRCRDILHPMSQLYHDVATLFSCCCDSECDVTTFDFCSPFSIAFCFFSLNSCKTQIWMKTP